MGTGVRTTSRSNCGLDVYLRICADDLDREAERWTSLITQSITGSRSVSFPGMEGPLSELTHRDLANTFLERIQQDFGVVPERRNQAAGR